ncbi:putative metallopeptidase [Paratissierella segnis]|uniref:Putative phage metallopeptidase domain-containing protein n=1 Tax=Paratissierella segnis TaxID=2763679 RepID=A0A926EXH4_9FIRM|nr:putative metallopeptidase [Paratissierella segnis]MBC8589352.1 hypothetical protein [Paratissierella segnis]
MKNIRITDDSTGEIILEKEFSGGYHFIYTNLDDSGKLHQIRELDNAKFGDRHWIKNWVYRPIAEKLVKRFEELEHIRPRLILFLEDMEWEEPKSDKPKKHWIARISKSNKQFAEISGYKYILETRNYYIGEMQREQIIALLYHELRHIDQFGDLQPHDTEDWSNMLATLGTDWATTQSKIQNILEDDVIWRELEPLAKQLNVFNFEDYNRSSDKDRKAL